MNKNTNKPVLGAGGKLQCYTRQTSTGETLLAPGGKVLGHYNKNTNSTITAGGSFVGYSNVLLTLLKK